MGDFPSAAADEEELLTAGLFRDAAGGLIKMNLLPGEPWGRSKKHRN